MGNRESIEGIPMPPLPLSECNGSGSHSSRMPTRPWSSRKLSKQNQQPAFLLQQQQQPVGINRPSGLLSKMFRKGPSKAPKLNPVGISSKDYFADDSPSSAPVSTLPTEGRASTKSIKLTRKLSGVSPALSQSVSLLSAVATPLSLTPKSTNPPGVASLSYDGIHEPGDVSASTHTINTSSLPRQNRLERLLSPDPNIAQNQPRLKAKTSLDPPRTSTNSPLSGSKQGSPRSETLSSSSPTKSPGSSGIRSADAPQDHPTYPSKLPDASALHSSMVIESEKPSVMEAPEERKRRGSLWRTKLGFTNIRRPETRRQRHQSYENNAVDIAAHPQMYEEVPLTSVPPTTAPAASQGEDTGSRSSQPSFEAFLSMVDGASYPHSRISFASLGQSSGMPDFAQADAESVGNLGTIDKDFLLTIQRNSALEARRQRRRDTRRNTLSFLGAGDRSVFAEKIALDMPPHPPLHFGALPPLPPSALPATALPAIVSPANDEAVTASTTSTARAAAAPAPLELQDSETGKSSHSENHHGDNGSSACLDDCHPQVPEAAKIADQPAITNSTTTPSACTRKDSKQKRHSIGGSISRRSAGRLSLSTKSDNPPPPLKRGDGSEGSIRRSIMPSNSSKKPRPLSSDSLTYSETPVDRSSRPSSSDENKQKQEPVVLHRKTLSEAGGAFIRKMTKRLGAAEQNASEPLPSAHSNSIDQGTRMSQALLMQSSSSNPEDNGHAMPPPVPPLPLNPVLQARNQPKQMAKPPSSSLYPIGASDGATPRYTLSSRKYRNPISTLPPALHISTHNMQHSDQSMPLRSPTHADGASAVGESSSHYHQNSFGRNAQGSSGWDAAQAVGLYQYRISASEQGRAEPAKGDWLPIYQPQSTKHPNYSRKFSHPDAELQSSLNPPYSPIGSPDILSKSASSLAMRLSIDGSKANRISSGRGHKHGLSKFFSVAPSNRKAQQQKHMSGQGFMSPGPGNIELPPSQDLPDLNISADPPTSPVVSSLVGDPLARRRIRDQLASSMAFDRLLEEDDEFTMAISLTPTVAGASQASAPLSK